MLTPEYLKDLPLNILLLFEAMEDEIIADVSRRLANNIALTGTADYEMKILAEMGYNLDDVKKRITSTINMTAEEMDRIIQESSDLSYANDIEAYQLGGKYLPPLSENIPMVQIIEAMKKQTLGYLDNLSGTFGFIDANEFKVIDSYYHDVLNKSVLQVSSGAVSYDQAIRTAVRQMGSKGIRSIDYTSGKSFTIEHVSRMCTLTGVNQITGIMSEANADMMDQDIMEVTAHPGARPTHGVWQGQLVSRSGQVGYLTLSDIGHGDVQGFMGANCRHNWYPFFPGLSQSMWPKSKLDALDHGPIQYEGKVYNAYEATQRQRQIERSMRATKRDMIAYQNAGLDRDFQNAAVHLRQQKDLYKDFSRAADLPQQNIRHQTYDYGRSIAQKGVWANRKASK